MLEKKGAQSPNTQHDRAEWRRTEARSPRFAALETWPTSDVLAAMLEHQSEALHAVWGAQNALCDAVEAAANRLRAGNGRLVYIGAGTSGRLGVLDGVELPPTFGWPEARLAFVFAGGEAAEAAATEGAEDDAEAGGHAISVAKIDATDVVVGIAASGSTPYTRAALTAARKAGALTIAIANNPDSPLLDDAEHGVLLDTGPEILAGSTRLAAGTAQKIALNLFSTALMVALNKVYAGHMVEMKASNDKLRQRAQRMVAEITGCDMALARRALNATDYSIKHAILYCDGVQGPEAERLLTETGGDLGAARGRIATAAK